MWKNWIPFRRKQKDEGTKQNSRGQDSGKENEKDINPNFRDDTGLSFSARGPPQSLTPLTNSYATDQSFVVKSKRNSSGHNLTSDKHDMSKSFHNGNNDATEQHQDFPSNSHRVTAGNKRPGRNDSFSTVHGPLLSTPIMPKVRRVIETQSGLRSINGPSLLARGRPIGRSASLNYGPSNPAQSTAGQVPWVRLKRRESIALADIVKGRTPHSPNTIKIAAPEPSHLLPAPSFKVTPLIITEANRSRVIDTQTVVSALREKRKRMGGIQPDDIINDDNSWQNSAKRRRQDSSQSNASSVSIPPMPDSLPNLMASSGASILHIESVTGQRPSTVPSIDAYVNRHLHDIGLGGEQIPNQYQSLNINHKSSCKLTQRALHSSLSSSIRARNNLSLLERGGIDFSRIKSNSIGTPSNRRTSFSSDVSMMDKSSRQQSPTWPIESAPVSENTPSLPSSNTNFVSTVSAPTKRKIAEGVMLRKQNMSINSSNSPLRTQKSSTLVGAVDFEQDRNKEYQRRVLNLLSNEDSTTLKSAIGNGTLPSTAVSTSTLVTSSLSSTLTAVTSPAATSASVSASLDSLNKLVQSATGSATSPVSVTAGISVNKSTAPTSDVSSLSPISVSDVLSTKSTTPVTSSLLSSMLKSPNAPITSTPAATSSAAPSGFSLSTSTPGISSSSGFNVNFGSIASAPVTKPAISAEQTATSSNSTSSGLQFNFGSPNVAIATTSPLGMPSHGQSSSSITPTDSQTQSGLGVTSISSGFALNFNSQQPCSSSPAVSTLNVTKAEPAKISFSFGSQSQNQINSQESSVPAPTTGAFNFGSTAPNPTVSSAMLQLAAGLNTGSNNTSVPTPAGGFNFNLASSTNNTNATTSLSSAGVSHFSAHTTSIAQASAPSVFNIASTASPVTSTMQVPQIGLQTQGIFGSTVSSSSAPSASGGVPVFNFGSVKPQQNEVTPQPVVVQTPSPFATPAPKPNPAGGFNLGQSTTTAPSSGLFAFGSTPAPSSNVSTFGSTATASTTGPGPTFGNAPSNSGANPLSVFPASSTMGAPSAAFGSGVSSNTSAPVIFGGPSSSGSQPSNFGQTTSASSPFVFGAQPSAAQPPAYGTNISTTFGTSSAPATGAPSAFGSNPLSSNIPNFGSSTAPSGVTVFGAQNTSTNSANAVSSFSSGLAAPSFGSGQMTQSGAFGTAAATQPGAFGTAAATQPGAFGTAAVTQPGAFGTAAVTQPGAFGATAATQPGAFGATAATQPGAFGATAATQPGAFGAMAGTQLGAFGAMAGTQLGAFGTAAATQPGAFGTGQMTQPGAFGTAATTQPGAFGSGATTQTGAFGSGATTQTGAFGSGATTQPGAFGSGATNQPSVFGSGATAQSSMFGSGQAQPSVFGSGTTTQSSILGSGATATQPSVFGAGTTSQSNAFGSGATSRPSVFGTGQTMQQAPFASGQTSQPASFGSGTNAFGVTSPSTPAFGTAAQPTAPSFGTANTSGVTVFGAPKANQFDAKAPAGGNAFTFGSNQMSQNATASNPFNATNSASTGFNFKSPTGQTAAPAGGFNFAPQISQAQPQPSAAGFNFSAASGGASSFNFSANPNAPNTPNMFTPQAPGTVHRPRAAARRGVRRGARR